MFKKNLSVKAFNHECGVLLADLIDKQYRQIDLFHQPNDEEIIETEKVMKLIDGINQKHAIDV
ncbi:hypothetical protein [Legionella jamestowniensis]|uniref:Uncharacterized protein n=1 Tax=Legionella jamestowniensis TaxID=455 RepID=A0ABX2Y4D9_9GAMM|nr:hypothetical protein [Legionella jamestowniensis]OCH99125.1 hypothetical protein A8135_07660 [Legionella jamestowniensis]